MPLYDYDCEACGRRFEVVHGVHSERPTVCPICGSGPIRKAISAAAVHFKGSGWAKKERRAPVTRGASKASGDGSSSDGSSSDGGAKANDSNENSRSSENSSSSSSSATVVKPVETGSANTAD